jgi:murein DD-endopeptidase MepM/ murein hydrolase activator NlpD
MGRVGRARGALALAGLLAVAGALGCRSSPKGAAPGRGDGAWYVVRPGDSLWRISQTHGTPVEVIRRVNRVEDVRALRIGQRLWIPGAGPLDGDGIGGPDERTPSVSAAGDTLERRRGEGWGGDCSDAAREHGLRFEWPVLGSVSSSYGMRGSRPHDGIDIAAPRGTPIHAAEAGKVVFAGSLAAYGRLVVIKHLGSWATVYAHNEENLVEEGDFVEKGDPIARVGRTGNATAPHLHFEIRRSNRARDPQACLP